MLERRVVVVARRGDRFLLVRNPDRSELLAGMWEFPWTARAARHAGGKRDSLGRTAASGASATSRGGARHAITFRSLELEIRDAEVRFDEESVAEGESRPEPGWFSLEQITAVPTTSMVRKVLACLDTLLGAEKLVVSDAATQAWRSRARASRLSGTDSSALRQAQSARSTSPAARHSADGVQEPLGERRLAAADVHGELGYERRLDFLEQPGSGRSIAAQASAANARWSVIDSARSARAAIAARSRCVGLDASRL